MFFETLLWRLPVRVASNLYIHNEKEVRLRLREFEILLGEPFFDK